MARRRTRRQRSDQGGRRCDGCGRRLEPKDLRSEVPMFPAIVVLAGGLLSLYLVGVVLIAVGIWMWYRGRRSTCPSCGDPIRI